MFGFAPKSPVSAKAGTWIEESMLRFRDLFGAETLQNCPVVLPTPEFFPDNWDGTLTGAQAFLDRVCGYMRVDPERVALELYYDEDMGDDMGHLLPHWEESRSGAAGLYSQRRDAEKVTITLKVERRIDLTAMVATIAHELGHVVLLADSLVDRDAEDMEPLTDLITVFNGLGIFNANSAVQFSQFQEGSRHGWSARRLGYLSEEMFGYALAFFAWLRQEDRPAWAKHLNVNVGAYFKQSLKFIRHEKTRAFR
jgi:hypothetical protein